MSTAFDNHALDALRTHAGQWHCLPCWARETGLNAPGDEGRLRMLARRLRFSPEHELARAGFCGGSAIKDDVLVRTGPS